MKHTGIFLIHPLKNKISVLLFHRSDEATQAHIFHVSEVVLLKAVEYIAPLPANFHGHHIDKPLYL